MTGFDETVPPDDDPDRDENAAREPGDLGEDRDAPALTDPGPADDDPSRGAQSSGG